MITFPFGFLGGAGAGASYLLDDYPGAKGAWSVCRQLSSTYSGNLIEIRRSSDSAYQDIGFDGNGDLDTGAITTFVGSDTAYVRTIYDQSGNGNNLSQSTTGNQPKIVNAGTLYTVNGKAAYYHGDKTDHLISSSSIGTATNNTHFSVAKYSSIDGGTWNIGFNYLTSGYYFSCRTAGGGALPSLSTGTPSYYKNGSVQTAQQAALYTAFHTDAQTLLSVTDLDFSSGWSTINIGGYGDVYGSQPFWFQEFVLYDSDQTSNQGDIETNINDYYTIF